MLAICDAAPAVRGAAKQEEAWQEEELDFEEAKIMWKDMCNIVFPKLGSFEPTQYLAVVAGRPVVVPVVSNVSRPQHRKPFAGVSSVSQRRSEI